MEAWMVIIFGKEGYLFVEFERAWAVEAFGQGVWVDTRLSLQRRTQARNVITQEQNIGE